MCYVEGIALDLLVRVRDSYVPTDFVILNMGISKDAPLILGHPFLNTANACIYVASAHIQFHLDGRKETFAFASGKCIFYEEQERKKQPKKRRTRKPKPIEKKEEPSKNKPKPQGNGARRKKHHLHYHRLILQTFLRRVRRENSRTRKKNPHIRRNSRESVLEGTLLLQFYCI